MATKNLAARNVSVNVVVLAGTVSADPVERRMPSGDEVPGSRGAARRRAKRRT